MFPVYFINTMKASPSGSTTANDILSCKSWDLTDGSADAELTFNVLKDNSLADISWVVVDNYLLSSEWETSILLNFVLIKNVLFKFYY